MKPFLVPLYFLLALVFLQSCGNSKAKNGAANSTPAQASSKIPAPTANSKLAVNNKEDMVGYWVGKVKSDTLYDNIADYEFTLNICVDTISGNEFKGHTVMLGIITPIAGTIEKENEEFTLLASRNGSGNLDGTFSAIINAGDTVLSGAWTPNKVIKGVSGRTFKLQKKVFQYKAATAIVDNNSIIGAQKDPQKKLADNEAAEFASTSRAVTQYNPSEKTLTKEDIANLKKADIMVLRNSIFARHGYAFKRADLRAFFEAQEWYIPMSTDVTAQLTDIEKKNLELLNRYEKNAEEYYRSFSR